MELNALTAISPIDGRYRNQLAELAPYYSEYGLIRMRVKVEIEYFLALAEEGIFNLGEQVDINQIRAIYEDFSEADAATIKTIERTTNHDVKAVEYFIKEKFEALGLSEVSEWVHFGLTSQDINNTSIPLLWKESMEYHYLPAILNLTQSIQKMAKQWMDISMLAKTHGQPASPTKLGKEWMVFVERLQHQVELMSYVPYAAKFGGATGNFNAHHVTFPEKDWIAFGNHFVEEILQLERMQFTTQIEHYDHFAAHCDAIKRMNTILIDFCRDIWTYISMEYFKQQTKKGEVGSSAMPHKVNPIDFENAEGNLGIANALLEHFAAKLPISRLQRDLTDSTVLRNFGMPIAHTILAIKAIEKGLGKLLLNEGKLDQDLEDNWAVVAEAIQTILRREGYPKPYEALKDLTRGNAAITKESIQSFISKLDVTDQVKEELLKITPQNYTGLVADWE